MKHILLTLLILTLSLPSCRGLDYYNPNPGTCLKREGSKFRVFIVKSLGDNYFLTLTYNNYRPEKILFGLDEESFPKTDYTYVKCANFKGISDRDAQELSDRREYKNLLKLIEELK